MLFVADDIPVELRRIVEFLNTQMSPAEVLAIEVRQFVGAGVRSLVPAVYGHTEEAQTKKGVASSDRQWTESSFLVELGRRHPGPAVDVARACIQWTRERQGWFRYGRGKVDGSLQPEFMTGGRKLRPVTLWTSGTVEIPFENLRQTPPFDQLTVLREFRDRLNGIPGVAIPDDGLSRRPNVPLSTFANQKEREQFCAVLDWWLKQAMATTA
jgi:hypothetical protein